MNMDFKEYDNFFSKNILEKLLLFYKNLNSRKVVFNFSNEMILANSLAEAVVFARKHTQESYNCGILKSYKLNDSYVSGAYEKHIDPVRYSSIPLFLCTLQGVAKLKVWDRKDNVTELLCNSNKLVLLDSTLAHKISPPIENNKERILLFLGIDNTFQP